MLAFENTIHIRRPTPEVFVFLADFENVPKWNYYVLEVRKRSNGPIRIGTRYHQIRKTDAQDFHITALEPNQLVAIATLAGSSPAFERRLTLAQEGGTTRVHDAWKLATTGPGLRAWVGARRVQSAVADNLATLKELLETGRVVLQDGRHAALD
jgi:carbon monoxide dehydrogenase subunit G